MPARTLNLDELGRRFSEMASVSDRTAAIGVTDAETAAYARVLEYGSVAGQRPWPHPGERTVAAVDPETGSQVVVSAQAPQGFIRMRAPEFLDQLREAISGPANWLDADELNQHFASAIQSATAQALEQMRDTVPRDSGRLAQSLTLVNG
jgi:hypothetical protein